MNSASEAAHAGELENAVDGDRRVAAVGLVVGVTVGVGVEIGPVAAVAVAVQGFRDAEVAGEGHIMSFV